MPHVQVDGVTYTPEDESSSHRIGIGVTTRDRPDAFRKTLREIRRFTSGVRVVVVDDASASPVEEATYRFNENVGVAQAKNKCLELLDDCEHIFLFDDDVYPVVDEWWVPYVESPEPHLMWTYLKPKGEHGGPELTELYRDSGHVYYHQTRGAVLYVENRVLHAVGGMDPGFGKWGWEHVSWSDRIHSAGFTSGRYIDVVGSSSLFHSMDEHKEVTSTAQAVDVDYSQNQGYELRFQSRDSGHFVEYRQQRDVVMTTLLTRQVDPQRGRKMRASTDMVRTLRDSVPGEDFVVLHDELEDPGWIDTCFEKVETYLQPYFQRHLSVYQYLRAHPEVRFVWCVDGTDVEMLRRPFPEMDYDTLYVGSEASTLRDEWLLNNHSDSRVQQHLRANPNNQLLNAGLIGGDRETVMGFVHKLVKACFDDEIDFIMGWETKKLGVGDMGIFNTVAYEEFSDVLSYGSHVNTVFKAEEKSNQTAWWRHK